VADKAKAKAFCTIAAKIIRADGSEEDLGVIGNATEAEADAALKVLRPIRDAHAVDADGDAAERAHEANKAASAAAQAANKAAAPADEVDE